MNSGFCIWLTGLSASGKTTIAQEVKNALLARELPVEVLDGDMIRENLSKGLGFTRADRETNLRRIAFVAGLLVRHGVVVVVAAITPYQSIREEVQSIVGELVEVYLNCPLEICIQRDPKGLYQRALSGEIRDFTGISDKYETPSRPDVELKTHLESPEDCKHKIIQTLEVLNKIPSRKDGLLEKDSDFFEDRRVLG